MNDTLHSGAAEDPAALAGPLHLNLLGGFEALLPDHRLVKISTKKNQALLGYLAGLEKPVPREKLAGLLWSERGHSQGRDSLRQSLVALRRDLAGITPAPLVIDGEVIALHRGAVTSDLQEFLDCARGHHVDALRRALELYSGDLLDGVAVRDSVFEQWLKQERARLHDIAVAALERLVPDLAGATAVAAARRLVGLDPLRESANLALVRAYARQGEAELAVRQARSFRALLKGELGVAPSPRFESEVAAIAAGAAPAAASVAAKPAPKPVKRPDKAVIAVLPFDNRGGGAESRFFADALTDNIITAVSRATMFRVVARSSAQTYVGEKGDFRKIAQELGADYVLEGGVLQAGEQIRLSARLIDARAGHHIWADRYECQPADLMDVQDTLARSVMASIETQIYLASRERGATTERTDAHVLIMRARGLLYDMSAEAFEEANALAGQAIARDPDNGSAYLILAEAHLHQLSMGLIPHDRASVERGLELSRAALGFSPGDEWAHSFMAKALSEAQRYEEAIGEAERALEINPSLSVAIARLGELHALMGRPEPAIEKCRLALKLNPRNPTNFWRHSSIALAHFVAGDYEAMLQEARRVQNWRPDFIRGPLLTAVALAALERPAEAGQAVRAAEALAPALDLATVVPRFLPRFARDADHERLITLLLQAGLSASRGTAG